jgi:hypothetical protein
MDPLKPFANLIRSLWSSTKGAPARATAGARTAQASAGTQTQAQAIAASTQVSARLQARLAALREWNSVRARELFVEHALLMQFGGDLAHDPTFAELVQRVSAQLATEPALGARLDQLLQDLAANNV